MCSAVPSALVSASGTPPVATGGVRHVPGCRSRWLVRQQARLLACEHEHAICTMPHALHDLWLATVAVMSGLLCALVHDTLLAHGRQQWGQDAVERPGPEEGQSASRQGAEADPGHGPV
jgi:hypothetical protein